MIQEELIVKDEEVAILTPKQAIAPGHIILTTVTEYNIFEEVPPAVISKMFQIANKVSSVLFDTMKCHGTNILIQNGLAAGQINSRFSLNIIPRFENDGLKLEWKPKSIEPERIQSALNKLQDSESADQEKKYLEEQKQKAEEKKKSTIIKSGDDKKKRNYFIRSLEKVA